MYHNFFTTLSRVCRVDNSPNEIDPASPQEPMDLSDSECSLPELLIEQGSPEPENTITGRRIVDINHVLRQLEIISSHGRVCTMGRYKFQRKVVNGLISTFYYYCDNCEKECSFTNEPTEKGQEINNAIVWGSVSIGIGYSQTEELLSVLDVPMMGRKKFVVHEKKIGKVSNYFILHSIWSNNIVALTPKKGGASRNQIP